MAVQKKRATIVIGAGLGGLAAAARIASAGEPVLVLESRSEPGGKAGRRELGGCTFDTGPSVLTLPQFLHAFFAACGQNLADWLELHPVEPGCRYRFADGTVFDAPGTLPAFREALAQAFPDQIKGFDAFARHIRRLWEVSEPFFLTRPLDRSTLRRIRPADLWRGRGLLLPWSLHRLLRHHFTDPRLVQLFARFATYNGSDPYRTPAAFAVIAHAELAFGSWRCAGGMHALPQALRRLGASLGAEYRFNTPVARVLFENGRPGGVELDSGERLPASRIIVNADGLAAWTGPLLAGHPRQPGRGRRLAGREPSSSGFVLLLALRRQFPDLKMHNVFFSGDYPLEFDQLFHRQQPLTDPTLYISIPSRSEPGLAPPGGEGWFVLVNAPSRTEPGFWPAHYEERILEALGRAGLPLRGADLLARTSISPVDFEAGLGAWRGSLYGPSCNPLLSAFLRLPNRDRSVPGLYFCGGSAHPGGGIPLVVTSGRLAAEAVLADSRSPR
ncbi:MAG: phytoene desaturase [Puniceicoccaceae bacterium]|nr:MAG: phytoene desaturase [Puniceicoccaceae bacterium]